MDCRMSWISLLFYIVLHLHIYFLVCSLYLFKYVFSLLNHYYFSVRLVNGFTKYEGRVEVYLNGELGYGKAIAATYDAFYGQGSSRVQLDGVFCNGTEWTIRNCSNGGLYLISNYYRHSNDAGVQCNTGNVYALE